jgi:deazaflavin-dependent oxidoreductase (nitroreductase family)
MRIFMRIFTIIGIGMYYLTGGLLSGGIGRLHSLLLTTTGRRSGKKHTIPLGFFEQDGGYVITASNGGQDKHPAWFLNLRSSPRAEINVRMKRIEVTAEIAAAEQRARLWAELMKRAPSYANYAQSTEREIPMVILRPVKL